jgi:hypothetical protein
MPVSTRKTVFPRTTLARRSTSKKKSKRKEEVNILPAQDLKGKEERGKCESNLTWGGGDAQGEGRRSNGELAKADGGWRRRRVKAADESSKQRRRRSAGGSLRGEDLRRSESDGASSSKARLWRRPAATRLHEAKSSKYSGNGGKCEEEDGVEPPRPYIGERVSGPKTIGPRRFVSWATTWREDTRVKIKRPQGRRTDPEWPEGSGVAHLMLA